MKEEKLFEVGQYIDKFNKMTDQHLPCGTIYQSHGLKKHIQKRHPAEIYLLDYVEKIIKNPDYIGRHPKEPDSVELVKVIEKNIMVCIKLDCANEYFYVSSVFSISNAKLNNRIHAGRLKKY